MPTEPNPVGCISGHFGIIEILALLMLSIYQYFKPKVNLYSVLLDKLSEQFRSNKRVLVKWFEHLPCNNTRPVALDCFSWPVLYIYNNAMELTCKSELSICTLFKSVDIWIQQLIISFFDKCFVYCQF